MFFTLTGVVELADVRPVGGPFVVEVGGCWRAGEKALADKAGTNVGRIPVGQGRLRGVLRRGVAGHCDGGLGAVKGLDGAAVEAGKPERKEAKSLKCLSHFFSLSLP